MNCTYYEDNLLEIYQRSFRENWDLPALAEYGSPEVMSYGTVCLFLKMVDSVCYVY